MITLLDFVRESNKIEAIVRPATPLELSAHESLLRSELELSDVERFVAAIAPGHSLRRRADQNVRVGNHIAPIGGWPIVETIEEILADVRRGTVHPYATHQRYEFLHPFTDGNGRSGRAIWLWSMFHQGCGNIALERGFLHEWYYQSLQFEGKRYFE